MGDQTTTTRSYAGEQSAEARRMLELMEQYAGQDAGYLGQIAEGTATLTGEQRQAMAEAQRLSGDLGRQQQELNFEQVKRQLEDTLIGRGMDTSTIGAVSQATLGQQQLADLNAAATQGQLATQNQMVNVPLQAAQNSIGANQALLQRLVGTANPTLNYDAMIRQLNATGEQTQPFNWSAAAGGLSGAAEMYAAGTAGAPS